MANPLQSIIIFASGGGSNTRAIINHFKGGPKAAVALIVSNKADAGVLNIAKEEHIPFLIINKETLSGVLLIEQLNDYKPALIVLAGFIWKLPAQLVNLYHGKIINIHPALLPAYGGKGMHGLNVHSAVIEKDEKESGISIHQVNEYYDEGDIILQARCPVEKGDDANTLAARVLKLEHFYYPRTIEFLLRK